MTIHETLKVVPQAPIPEHSRSKGYRDFIVQDLLIQAHNTCYRREVWLTPDGELLLGELPASLNGGHFGPELRRYVSSPGSARVAYAAAVTRVQAPGYRS